MAWRPPSTIEEKLKELLVPAGLYMRYRVAKELRRGEAETHLLPFLTDRSKISLDIGANKGVYTHLLAPLSLRVHAYEPNPKPFAMLIRALPANAKAEPLALSSTTGHAEMRIPKTSKGYSNQGGSLSQHKVKDNFGAVSVETKRVDELGLGDIGFIKIDVEGFELDVLEGATETLRRDRPVLLVEMEENHTGIAIEEMIRTVEGYGYQTFALFRGRLTPAGELDFEACHRAASSDADYVFNFIFFPA